MLTCHFLPNGRLLVPLCLLFLLLFCTNPLFAADDAPSATPITDSETADGAADVRRLPPLTVTAKPLADGRHTLSAEDIQRLPTRDGSLADTLVTVPRVQFSDSARLATAAGEILPPLVSISGGRTYDNNLQLNGFGINSLLDPGQGGAIEAHQPSGHPQGLLVDNRLLGEVTVYSHNVPARYGGFTGGVVDARTREPLKRFGGGVYYRTTRDQWTAQQDMDGRNFEEFAGKNVQTRFRKHQYGADLSVPLTTETGILVYYGHQQSRLRFLDLGSERKQRRQLENFFLKFRHEPDPDTTISASVLYTPYTNEQFRFGYLNSEHTIEAGGLAVNLRKEREFDGGRWEAGLTVSRTQNSRQAPRDNFQWRTSATKDWGEGTISREGWYGDVTLEQDSYELTLDGEYELASVGPVSQRLGAGIQLRRLEGLYHRKETTSVYLMRLDPNVDCAGDEACVDNEQYANSRLLYSAGRASAEVNEGAVYLDDQLRWGRLGLRPGLRLSYDNLLQNLNAAPRSLATYDLFGNGATVLSAGANRYYGTYLLTYKLRQGIQPVTQQARALDPVTLQPLPWSEAVAVNSVLFDTSALETPYADEVSLGVQQKLFGGLLTLSGVQRNFKDQFAREPERVITENNRTWTIYRLNNNASRRYRSASLFWEREWLRQSLGLGVTWQHSEGSNQDYDDQLTDEELDTQVLFEGDVIAKADLPPEDFNRAWIGQLTYTVELPFSLQFTNVASYRSGYWDIVDTGETIRIGEDVSIPVYAREKLKPGVVFDWQLRWQKEFMERRTLALTLELYNVFNRKMQAGGQAQACELGRQLWAGVEIAF